MVACTLGVVPKEGSLGIEYYSENTARHISTVLEENDDEFSYLSMLIDEDKPETMELVRVFYDSAEMNVGLDSLELRKDEDDVLFSNLFLSDQAYIYADKALEILRAYMSMEMSHNDAYNEISDLQDRALSYIDMSDNPSDYKLYGPFISIGTSLTAKDDGAIQKTINRLEQLTKNE